MILEQYFPATAPENLLTAMQDGQERICYTIFDDTYILRGRDGIVTNFKTLDFGFNGNSILVNKGDIGILSLIKNESNLFANFIIRKVCSFLRNRNINAAIDGNDIIVDAKYKITGCSFSDINGMRMETMFFCNTVNATDIEKIFDARKKVPKGIGEFGVSVEELTPYFIKWFNEFSLGYSGDKCGSLEIV